MVKKMDKDAGKLFDDYLDRVTENHLAETEVDEEEDYDVEEIDED